MVELKNITKFCEELACLKKAFELLSDIYVDVLVDGKVSDELQNKLKDFFGYDDSE